MMRASRTILSDHEALWHLVDACQLALGSADELMAMAEDSVGAALLPWASFPRRSWQRGRVFGQQGEIQWRAYGGVVRVLLLTEAPSLPTPAKFMEMKVLDLEPTKAKVQLWRCEPYSQADTVHYLDDEFVRYAGVA